jgi:hypothetical protein
MTEYVTNVCKFGQGELCCRYLVKGSEGWLCGKIKHKMGLDEKWAKEKHGAQGDNCSGIKDHSVMND